MSVSMSDSPTQTETTPTAPGRRLRIGELLCSKGLITKKQLDEALAYQEAHSCETLLGKVLVEQGYITENKLVAALASFLGIPFAQLNRSIINDDALNVLPAEKMRRHNVLPLSVVDGWLTLAMEDFANVLLIEEITRKTGHHVQVVAASGDDIRRMHDELGIGADDNEQAHAPTEDSYSQTLDDLNVEELTLITDEPEEDEESLNDLQEAASDSPLIRLVDYIILQAVKQKASDIHVEPEDKMCRVRYRRDGDLIEQMRPSYKLMPALVSRIKIMASMDISERRLPQDGGLTIMYANRPIDLRVSTMPTKYGEKIVMRIIDDKQQILNLEKLGFSPDLLEGFRSAIRCANGIVLVTGPTGSGKTTTLYAALHEIASEKRNISTIEDPVEYNMKGINQFQVNAKAGFTFATALRSLLRQDPDIVMVGEIRDTETAKLAAEAALTGHLVLATLHTNDAPSAVVRLVNMGVEPYLVAASLRAVLAQRLVKRLCPKCRRETTLNPSMTEMIGSFAGTGDPPPHLFESEGCANCQQSGYTGRTAVHELLLTDEQMVAGPNGLVSLSEIRERGRERGYRTLLEDGLAKAEQGLIGLNGLFEAVSYTDVQMQAGEQEAPGGV